MTSLLADVRPLQITTAVRDLPVAYNDPHTRDPADNGHRSWCVIGGHVNTSGVSGEVRQHDPVAGWRTVIIITIIIVFHTISRCCVITRDSYYLLDTQ